MCLRGDLLPCPLFPYTDHIKRYKKRPIYWLFSSPGSSFNALIYMHRYRPDTVSVVINDYLREFRTKLTSRKDHLEHIENGDSASKIEKTRAIKEIGKLKTIIDELENWERDTLYPLRPNRCPSTLMTASKSITPNWAAPSKPSPA